jgi:hypothetical protein
MPAKAGIQWLWQLILDHRLRGVDITNARIQYYDYIPVLTEMFSDFLMPTSPVAVCPDLIRA